MSQRITLVTGAGSGIGRATAHRFAAAGDRLVIADINDASAGRVVEEIRTSGGVARAAHVDVAEIDSIESMVAAVERDIGPIGALVNSAGVLQNASAYHDMDLTEHDRVWAINYRGTYLCCRVVGPWMAQRGTGSIVNISSTSAFAPFPIHAYGPGKAAIDQLTAILAGDLGPSGVRVNAVAPGYVRTEQMSARIESGHRDATVMERQAALGRMVMPDEIAAVIEFLCSDAASIVTGTTLLADAGFRSNVYYRAYPGLPQGD